MQKGTNVTTYLQHVNSKASELGFSVRPADTRAFRVDGLPDQRQRVRAADHAILACGDARLEIVSITRLPDGIFEGTVCQVSDPSGAVTGVGAGDRLTFDECHIFAFSSKESAFEPPHLAKRTDEPRRLVQAAAPAARGVSTLRAASTIAVAFGVGLFFGVLIGQQQSVSVKRAASPTLSGPGLVCSTWMKVLLGE